MPGSHPSRAYERVHRLSDGVHLTVTEHGDPRYAQDLDGEVCHCIGLVDIRRGDAKEVIATSRASWRTAAGKVRRQAVRRGRRAHHRQVRT